VTHCRSTDLLTRHDSAYRLARAVTCFSVIVPRTGRWVGAAFPGSGELTGVDVETFPGGGEPSAVKSDHRVDDGLFHIDDFRSEKECRL
jgi:hypothetical protein